MQLITCKVELKLNSTNYFPLSANDNYNDDGNFNNIIISIKDTKFYVPALTISPNDNRKVTKLPSKRFEKSVYWNEYKTKKKVITKIQQMSLDIFSSQNIIWFGLNVEDDAKGYEVRSYYLPTGTIKSYKIIMK